MTGLQPSGLHYYLWEVSHVPGSQGFLADVGPSAAPCQMSDSCDFGQNLSWGALEWYPDSGRWS